MILMSYDGSADAQAAMDRVAELMPGAEMTVLTVWDPFVEPVVPAPALAEHRRDWARQVGADAKVGAT